MFNAIRHNEVLTLHRDYFRLRKPIERRIYELARKHCGQQPSWKVSVDVLLKKSGSKSKDFEFRRAVRNLKPGWDVCHLEQEFRNWLGEEEIVPKNPEKMFLKFCKSWFEKRGRP